MAIGLSSNSHALGLRNKDLRAKWGGSKTAKIAYELRRLRSRGAIKKIKNTHNYQLAEEGYEWMSCMLFSSSYFVSPLLSKYCKRAVEQDVENPSTIEEAYSQINKGSTPYLLHRS